MRSGDFRIGGGQVKAFRDGRMLVTSWRAETRKKPIFMISTGCSARPIRVRRRRDTVTKPSVVDVYNNNMNGVDTADQLTVFYSFVRKTRKWWRKVFFWLMETSVVNSYLLYKQSVARPKSHLDYRRALVETLAVASIQQGPQRSRVGAPRKSLEPHPRLQQKPHFIAKSATDRDCVVCSRRGRETRHRTVYYCETCTTSPYLCPGVCFKRYQTLLNYKL